MFSRLINFLTANEEESAPSGPIPDLEAGRNLLVSPNLESVFKSQASLPLAQKFLGANSYLDLIQQQVKEGKIQANKILAYSSHKLNASLYSDVDRLCAINSRLPPYVPMIKYLIAYILKQKTGKYSFCIVEEIDQNRYSCVIMEVRMDRHRFQCKHFDVIAQ